FRGALEAMSRPGRVQTVSAPFDAPKELERAACALALTLLDQDTCLWFAPKLAGAASYLRFHTGCTLAAGQAAADFALLDGTELPRLDAFRVGSDDYPDRSATLIIQVRSLEEGPGLRLSGPGIRGTARVAIGGLGEAFWLFWGANRALFPRGVDVFFASGERL